MKELFYLSMLKLVSEPTKVDGALHFENMDIGGMVTALGIFVVFLILIAISLLLAIFSILVKDKNKQADVTAAATQTTITPVSPVRAAPAPVQNYMDDKELVAVITAAIAASMGTGTDGLVVRRIRRVGNWTDTVDHQQNSLY